MDEKKVIEEIVDYLRTGNPLISELASVPLDESLVELGLMDSFGVVEIISFLESKYQIKIEDEDITKERFGSIRKMAALSLEKLD